jgi:hypothetical protein
MTKRSLLAFGAAVFLSCAQADAAQFYVSSAQGIGLRPGTALDSAKPLLLKQGQHVTLISDTGVTLTLDGPYDKPPAEDKNQGVDVAATLNGLVTQQGRRVAGVVRGATSTADIPSPWLLDASRSGTVCLLEGREAVFWRPQATMAATFSIMPADRSWKAQSSWAVGADELKMAAQASVHGNATYFVSLNGTESAIAVSLVPAALANDRVRAAWMADKGCESQAKAMLRTLQ